MSWLFKIVGDLPFIVKLWHFCCGVGIIFYHLTILLGRSCSWCVYFTVNDQSLCEFSLSPLATGDGDIMMRHCPSYRVVHLMKEGLSVQDACDQVILEMKERHGSSFEVAIIALNMKVS